MRVLPLLLLSAALLLACDARRIEKLEEGVATEADVRQQFGDPVTITEKADGSKLMEYPRQPEGSTNYLITIGADGKLSALRQLLTPANFARVQPGLAGFGAANNLLLLPDPASFTCCPGRRPRPGCAPSPSGPPPPSCCRRWASC